MLPGSRPAARRSRTAFVIGAVVGTVALGGCAAGQVAQTAYQANASGGATVTTNGIAVRDAQIAFGEEVEGAAVHRAGSSAPLEMHIISESAQDDRLVSVSSPIATSAEISGPTDLPAGVVMVVGGESGTAGQTAPGSAEPSAEPPLDATLSAEESAEPTAPASAEDEPSDTSPTGAASASGEAPAAGLQPPPAIAEVVPSTRYTQIVLTGLREDVRAGLLYEVVLNFERAGQVRVPLPVAYPGQPREEAEHGG